MNKSKFLLTTSLFISYLMISLNTAFAVVGGQITENDKVWRLSKCRNITSEVSGAYYGCEDLAQATGSFISNDKILTAGHFAAHFVFNPDKHYLKLKSGDKEYKLRYNKDFFIKMPKEYKEYEKLVRNKNTEKKASIETCSKDIAVITLSESTVARIASSDFYTVEKDHQPIYCQAVKMYGYGVYKYEVYKEKTRTFKSSLNWLVSLGQADSKTWVKNKKSDDKLRVGSNILKPATESLLNVKGFPKKDFGLDSIRSIMKDNDYYNSFMSSGDSGGPIILNGRIVGITCSINSINHENGEISIVNLITPTYSAKLNNFWSRIDG